MWIPLLTGVLALWCCAVAVVIILQRRSAAATLAWLLALTFLPLIGLAIYRLIGPLRLERKKFKRSASKRIVGEALSALAALDDEALKHQQLARLGMQLGEASPLRADTVELFLDGASTYAAILAAVAAAQHHIHLEYYIWEPDQIGTQLRDALVARARAGVKVRLIVGTANLDNRSFRLNFEVAAVVVGNAANTSLADAFTADLRDSREVTRGEFDRQSFGKRLGQARARLISPLL